MKITEDIVRGAGAFLLYCIATIVFIFYMPEPGEYAGGFFILFAIVWGIVTTAGFGVAVYSLGIYFWDTSAGQLSDWINKQLAR